MRRHLLINWHQRVSIRCRVFSDSPVSGRCNSAHICCRPRQIGGKTVCDDYTPHQTQISKQNQIRRLALVYIDCVCEHSMDQYWPDKPAMDCLNVYMRVFAHVCAYRSGFCQHTLSPRGDGSSTEHNSVPTGSSCLSFTSRLCLKTQRFPVITTKSRTASASRFPSTNSKVLLKPSGCAPGQGCRGHDIFLYSVSKWVHSVYFYSTFHRASHKVLHKENKNIVQRDKTQDKNINASQIQTKKSSTKACLNR